MIPAYPNTNTLPPHLCYTVYPGAPHTRIQSVTWVPPFLIPLPQGSQDFSGSSLSSLPPNSHTDPFTPLQIPCHHMSKPLGLWLLLLVNTFLPHLNPHTGMCVQSSTALLTTFSDRVMPVGKSQSSLLQNATLFTMSFISGLTVLASQTLTKPEETTGNASNKSGLTFSSMPGTCVHCFSIWHSSCHLSAKQRYLFRTRPIPYL